MSRRALFLTLILTLSAANAPALEYVVEEGVLGEAPYRLAVPEPWEGGILLLAVLDPDDLVTDAYLERGWLVAATGYRRNGWILEDGAADLAALFEYIVEEYGTPRRVVVEGTSLGANIGLLMAETEGSRLDGLVALAADPAADGTGGAGSWNWNPRVPVLLLSNRDEYALAEDYAARVGGEAVRPALWLVDRDGHANLNARERLAAHAALQEWLERGVRPPGWVGEPHDATVAIPPPRSLARPSGEGWEGRVTAVDPVYGNVDTDLVAADLEAVCRRQGAPFLVRGFGTEETVRWEAAYGDVPRGRLVALVTAEGYVRIAVNQGSAADRLGLRAGDPVVILPKEKRKVDPRR